MSVNPSGGAGSDERRQRLRDQMKAFYGDPNASTKRSASQAATPGNPNVPPELDLDSEYFNVNRYTTDLLKRESLKGLVETDTELLRRVRRLDGELQELVYRNYARFISATDTIREMKDNVVEMDAKLQTLSQNVNTIDGISSQISQQLQVHRSHIEETITANRMLKKVQFLTSLPTTMRRLIDKEEFNIGVKYWVAGDGFLTKHKSIASITQIQQSCCKLAGELYSAIEQRMCSCPLDDPDAMDRIRGYVEDLRLLRATSLFESAHMADQPPFEEVVLQTLMKSVTANFTMNVATTQRSLKAALVIPEDISVEELTRREASMAQANLQEPLAQLKNACAMLAVNSERVYALLDANTSSADASSAAAQAAKDIQPVLTDLLQPLGQSLMDFVLAHLDAIAMDGGSAMRDPAASAAALQSCTKHFTRLLKQFVTAMKTLAEIYLTPLVPAADAGFAGSAPPHGGRTSLSRTAAAVGSPVTADNAVRCYVAAVHTTARGVLEQYVAAMQAKVTQAPDTAVLQACVPIPVVNTSVVSALPPMDAVHTQKLAFVHTRFLYAALSQCTADALRAGLVGEDGVPMDVVAELMAGLERCAQQLQHRGIILLGQLEVESLYNVAFAGASGEGRADGDKSSDKTPTPTPAVVTVSTALMQLLPEWSTVYDTLKALPPVTAAAAAATSVNNNNSGSPAGRGGVPVGSPALRRRETSFSTGSGAAGTINQSNLNIAGLGYRVDSGSNRSAYGGGASSSNGAHSDHRGTTGAGTNTGSTHLKSGNSKLAVAYTRQVMSALQLSVNNIFANTETALRTEPVAGPPSLVMACVVRYVLQGIVDRVRGEVHYTEAQFQRLQISCTFLLYALLAPAKGTVPRQWRKEWSEEDMSQVQRLLDEACTCAYECYETKVPLAAAVLEKIVESAVRGGRAALAAGATAPFNADSASKLTATVAPLPQAAAVEFPDDAPPPIPAALQRTANIASTSAVEEAKSSPVRHDDPLQSPQSNQPTTSSSRGPSRPFAPSPPANPPVAAATATAAAVSPPPPPQASPEAPPASTATNMVTPVVPTPTLPAPPALPVTPKISAPPPSMPRRSVSAAAPAASPPAAASTQPPPPPSQPQQQQQPAAMSAQYYGGEQTERVQRIDEEEELPM